MVAQFERPHQHNQTCAPLSLGVCILLTNSNTPRDISPESRTLLEQVRLTALPTSSFTLEDPFGSSFGSMSQLTGVTLSNDGGANYAFMTDNSGQLSPRRGCSTEATSNTVCRAQTYVNTRTQMEVAQRWLSKDGTSGSAVEYPIYHESGTSSQITHSCTMIDGSSVGEKYWTFSLTPPYVGLATEYQGRTPTTAPCSGVPSSTAMTQNLLFLEPEARLAILTSAPSSPPWIEGSPMPCKAPRPRPWTFMGT